MDKNRKAGGNQQADKSSKSGAVRKIFMPLPGLRFPERSEEHEKTEHETEKKIPRTPSKK